MSWTTGKILSEEQNITLTVNSIRPLLRTAWKRSSELLKRLFSMVFLNQVMFLSILSPSCKNSYRRLCRSYRLLLHEQLLQSLKSSKQRQQSKPRSEQMKEANACPKPFTAVICGDYIASKYFPAVWMTRTSPVNKTVPRHSEFGGGCCSLLVCLMFVSLWYWTTSSVVVLGMSNSFSWRTAETGS